MIESDYRYDHLRFTLRPDRRIPINIRQNCFPTGYEDGVFYFPIADKTARDLFDCHVDPLSGSFICSGGAVFTTRKGIANFVDIKINGIDYLNRKELVFTVGDPIVIDTIIRKVGSDKCLKLTLDNDNQVVGIELNGTNQYQINYGGALSINVRGEISAPRGIIVNKINFGNTKDVSFNVRFFDKKEDEIINFDGEDIIEIDGTKLGDNEWSQLKVGSKIIINRGDRETEISFVDQKLVLKKQNAEIEIVDINLPRDLLGNVIKSSIEGTLMANVGGAIIAYAPLPTTQLPPAQTKTLTLALYHIKGEYEAFTGPDSCNFNDPVLGQDGKEQVRQIPIRVEQKSSQATQGPVISQVTRNPLGKIEKEKIDNIMITATITHPDGIKSAKLNCIRPDGAQILPIDGRQQSNNIYQFVISQTDLTVASKYKCKIEAESLNERARINTYDIEFEVRCGPENNNYGDCKGSDCIFGSNKLTTGLKCPSSSN